MKKSIPFLNEILQVMVLIALGHLMVACGNKDQSVPPPIRDDISPEESAIAREALVDWLECEECTENQLESVLQYSENIQPMLIGALIEGVAPASRELYKRELEKRYDELEEYATNHPHSKPALPKQEFVDLYLGNLRAQYQTRAAQALAMIGGDDANRALQDALRETDREDVRIVITQALNEMK